MDNNNYYDDEYNDEIALKTGKNLKELFKQDQLKYFQHRSVDFWHKSFPVLASTMTKEQIEHLALDSMKRAEYWNGKTEREIWYYMIPIGYFGFFFDIDPQYIDLRKAANWDDNEELYFNRIHAFLDQIDINLPIFQEDWTNFEEKMKYIDDYYHTWNNTVERSENQKKVYLEAIAEELFPRKWEILSLEARSVTLETNLKRAENIGLPTRESILYGLASLYFGFAFERSPVFPWAAVLIDTKLSPEKRVKSFIKNSELFFAQLIDAILKQKH
ncbi:hypothetical protein [Bartonella sp. HY038]|uniref:hypothetical protein n=1 Tax=Bartonella sp. HY038 TaxID=2759660 RepID=UPI0015FB3C60|nr:hypothetical protein [Bartonella sp. HY038]